MKEVKGFCGRFRVVEANKQQIGGEEDQKPNDRSRPSTQ